MVHWYSLCNGPGIIRKVSLIVLEFGVNPVLIVCTLDCIQDVIDIGITVDEDIDTLAPEEDVAVNEEFDEYLQKETQDAEHVEGAEEEQERAGEEDQFEEAGGHFAEGTGQGDRADDTDEIINTSQEEVSNIGGKACFYCLI